MRFGKHKIDQDEAISAVMEYFSKEGKEGTVDFSEIQEESEEWTLRGTCIDDEKPTLAEKFEIVLDNKGKVKSADYTSDTQKKAPKEATSEKVPAEILKKDNLSDTVLSEIGLKDKKYFKSQKEKSLIFRADYERTVKKIESLLSAEQQLFLEREKLLKELEAKAQSLEQEVKGIESEVQRIKLFLNQEKSDDPNLDLEMQMVPTQ